MQMKLGKLLAETKTGEKRQIEPEKDGRGQKYEFELAGYHFFVRDMVKKTEESDEENQEYFITRRIVGKRKEASGKKEGIALLNVTLSLERKRIFFEWEYRQRYMVHM